jgi:[acyl-carrier-protein] S-malonyltransferase
MRGKLAYIFPGQGSQAPGMGKDLASNFPAARLVFEEADEALGFSISKMCFEGSAEELQLTENTQPAILTLSVAAWRAMESEGLPQPDFVAGHSLGEYSALVAAGALSLADAARTVRARGRYMQEATPVGSGAMAAIMGLELSVIKDACEEAQGETEVCQPANINAPEQVVIAGHDRAVERAIELLNERGAKRAIKLKVSAPFHCALMRPAQERLASDLSNIEFGDLRMPLVTNVDAALVTEGAAALDALVRQVSSPVRWQESMELLLAKGVETLVEVGPGRVLTGLMRRIRRDAQMQRVEDAESLSATRAALVVV